MTKLTLFLLSICLAAVVECTGNYFWPYPGSQDIVAYPQYPPPLQYWQPVDNCDKKENVEEGSSESSSSESESSSSESSESSSSESKESKESGEEKEGEGEGSKEESKSSSEEEEGSSSSEEGEKKEGSGEEGEGKEEPKKKKKKEEKESKPFYPNYLFPPRPAAVYAPSSSYALMPYRTSYVIQRPAATYPMKSSYQYVLPTSSAVIGGYSNPITYSRVISNPVAKLAYAAPTLGYPALTRAYVAAPSASVYSVPAASLTYIKK